MSQKSDIGGAASDSTVWFFQTGTGRVPIVEFMTALELRDRLRLAAGLLRLKKEGFSLRPPLAEHLGGSLYYLRIKGIGGEYRIFYWPYRRGIIVVGHAFSKKTTKCPPAEIERALSAKELILNEPDKHLFRGSPNFQP